MTLSDWQTHIDEAIARSLRHEAYHDAGVIGISGFSTRVIRCLFSNLVHLPKPDPVYVEFGLFAGGSFCASLSQNPTLTAYGVEDFSQPFGKDGVFDELRQNLGRYIPQAKEVFIVNQDAFTLDVRAWGTTADVISYDAVHDYWAQRAAWTTLIEPLIGETALVVIDDFSWEAVRAGTREGIADVSGKLRVAREWLLFGDKPNDDPVFHNGVALFLVERIAP